MEKDNRKKVVGPFIISLAFIAVSVNSIYRGVVHHEIWRIVAATAGGAIFIAFEF